MTNEEMGHSRVMSSMTIKKLIREWAEREHERIMATMAAVREQLVREQQQTHMRNDGASHAGGLPLPATDNANEPTAAAGAEGKPAASRAAGKKRKRAEGGAAPAASSSSGCSVAPPPPGAVSGATDALDAHVIVPSHSGSLRGLRSGGGSGSSSSLAAQPRSGSGFGSRGAAGGTAAGGSAFSGGSAGGAGSAVSGAATASLPRVSSRRAAHEPIVPALPLGSILPPPPARDNVREGFTRAGRQVRRRVSGGAA